MISLRIQRMSSCVVAHMVEAVWLSFQQRGIIQALTINKMWKKSMRGQLHIARRSWKGVAKPRRRYQRQLQTPRGGELQSNMRPVTIQLMPTTNLKARVRTKNFHPSG